MRRFRTTIVLAVATLSFVSICSAQQAPTTAVPNLIRYGGTLKDAQGAALPSSGAVGVTFAIYKQQDGGAPVWMETQNVVPDASGQYSVLLGSTTATGLPVDLFSQQEQRWLGVQVQGEAEQTRVLLVSVPYAFKAHEAETLAGKSISDFVLAKDLNSANSAAGIASQSGSGSTQAASGNNSKSPSKLAASAGPTNFSGSTTDQIVGVTQSGSGTGVSASAPSIAVIGTATASNGYGLYGVANGAGGVAIKGTSSSTSGTALRGTNTAATGSTIGVSAYVGSPAGIAAVLNNARGGKIISAQNNGVEKFSVDGSGNVNAHGRFTGSGAGLTGIQFSQLTGTLTGSQFGGTYGNAVTLSSASNVFYGNGSNLTGIVPTAGSPYYIQNGTTQQSSATFNISGNGTLGGVLSASAINTTATYEIGGSSVVNIGRFADDNLFLGVGAGAHDVGGSGHSNTFSGFQAGYSNTTGSQNTFSGLGAGYSNTSGSSNAFFGLGAGSGNTTGSNNTFSGWGAGLSNTVGGLNTFSGAYAGLNNVSGNYNTFSGAYAGISNSAGGYNTFSGFQAGYSNTTGNNNTFSGLNAGYSNTTGFANTFSGPNAGFSNTTAGNNNTFSGGNAGSTHTTGTDNSFYGFNAGVHSTGSYNTFSGSTAGQANTTGSDNTFSGRDAGLSNSTGQANTFIGSGAGDFNTTGDLNTFIGAGAGDDNETGSYNVYISNYGPGGGAESNTIRIGQSPEQTAAFIAGIYTTNINGSTVNINSDGQLGIPSSSLRFKEQVRDMGDSSSSLFQLRPVTFLYKPEYDKGQRTLQYGLIAEEVAEVYPDMVAYDKDGQPYTVKYQYLAPMLLNELQKQHTVVAAQQEVIKSLQEELQQQREEFQQRLARLEALIERK